jgi:hypothetical protein
VQAVFKEQQDRSSGLKTEEGQAFIIAIIVQQYSITLKIKVDKRKRSSTFLIAKSELIALYTITKSILVMFL